MKRFYFRYGIVFEFRIVLTCRMRITPPSILCGALGALTLAACHRAPPPPPPPATVIAAAVHSVAGSDADGAIRYPVEVLARYSNVLSFRVGGKLVERKVRLGDQVHKGEVIARLDALDAQRQAASAQAAFDAAEHRLAFAKQQLDRDTAQAAQDLIAANQLEQSQDAYAAALGARDQAGAQRVITRNNLDYNALVADHDGLITSENADTGQVVSAGQAVYGLAWSGDTDVVLDAAAADLASLKPGQGAQVNFAALPKRSFKAQVREVAPAADAQSRTYRVKLTLLDAGPDVRLGMTGDAVFTAAPRDNTVSIPATALFHQGDRAAVWVIRPDDGVLELRAVTVERYASRSVYVTAGLKPGETIVVAGVHTVYAGQHVRATAPLFAADDPAKQ
jgi:membrane fusion protein, multidrug efflux system